MIKDVKGFEGLYHITDRGEVFNTKTGRRLRTYTRQDGYVMVVLSKKQKPYGRTLHRLVAEAFIPNPENLRDVNHKNGIKTDNCVANLEWCSHAENMKHAYRLLLRTTKAVAAYDTDGLFVRSFASLTEAAQFCGAADSTNICRVARGARPTAHGYVWRYITTPA